ncbi:major facilitator superfamily transporter [Xylaria intraflava]|nr:major facilitator superfamily transporter [Xylaria intraflava]
MGIATHNSDSSTPESGKGLEAGEVMAPQQSRAESIWPAENLSGLQQVVFVFIVCMTQFCTQAAFTSSLFLLPVIGGSFGVTDSNQLAWLVAGYALTTGSFILFSGRLGDVFGYKLMFLLGLAWFSLWSLVVGLSAYSNFILMVFARVLQGIGPAICLPNALAILGSVYPPGPTKAMIFACFGAMAPIGAVTGAAVASALSLLWWPWAPWALSLWLLFLTVAGYIVVPVPPQKNNEFADGYTWRKVSEELDLPGTVTGVTALIVFNFAWNQAPTVGWATAETIVPLVAGLALFGVFAWIEFKVARRPLLPFDAINRDVGFVLVTVVCGWSAFGIWVLYFVRILQEVRHLTPLLTVAWISPVSVGGLVAALTTGVLLGTLKLKPPFLMTMALAAFTIGVTLTATVPADQIYWAQTFVCTVVMPFGMDMSFPAATLIISDAFKREHQGTGASLVNTVINYSISLAVGFAGTVETHVGQPDQLSSFRGGLYFGVGTAAFGLAICIVFSIRELLIQRKT